jgi:alpha-beta hydrolase superfamily lysophospholipase
MLGSLANFLSSELQLDVLAFDQIGHGRSSGVINNKTIETPLQEPDVYFPDYKLLYKIGWLFVQALLKQEEARYNKLPVFLFGKSMGGGTILHMLLHTPTPNPVTAVILEAPYIELTHPIPTFAQYALKGVSWVWSTMTVTKPQFDDFSRIPEQVQLRSTHKECYTKGLCAQTANELLAFSQALQQKASEIHFPMLLVHGTDDRTVSVHGSKKLFESNKNPDKEIKIYNGGYHGLTCDLCVREVEQDMKAWIEKHLS